LNVVANELRSTIAKKSPDFILTHAFEHGHPDHDCCSFLSAQLGLEFGIQVFEMPIYGWQSGGNPPLVQEFKEKDNLLRITPTNEQISLKREMVNAHDSQRRLGNLKMFHIDRPETFVANQIILSARGPHGRTTWPRLRQNGIAGIQGVFGK
jgi:LmbE family N-acetylglucosaminyl deacetylase